MKRIAGAVALVLCFVVASVASAQQPLNPRNAAAGGTLNRPPLPPQARAVTKFAPINFAQAAENERKNPKPQETELEEIDAPQPPPDFGRKGVPIVGGKAGLEVQSTPSFGTGMSPPPSKTFKAEFLSGGSIPPDTMGAVGTTHIVSVTNDRMRITTRDGVEISRMTLTNFWSGVTIKGQPIAAFDPKIYFDRFNNRFIFVSSGNGQSVNSGAMFAVTATNDPTGVWYRWSVVADPASTSGSGGSGHWIDYPSVGFNKNWIVVHENVFNYSCSTTSPFPCASTTFWGDQIYVLDKQAAYANTLGSISLFQADFNTDCVSPFEGKLGCGFTMAPAITEDNVTDTVYMVEDWDAAFGQLRLSKITGTPAAPQLTVGTQFPQSPNSWRFNASRITTATTATTNGTAISGSGGYMPEHQQSAYLVSGNRAAGNDSRIQNAVFRGGTLWTVHHVMLATTAQPAGQEIGRITANPPDVRAAVQWWQIDPTQETGGSVAPLQRARIEDPTADNCHNGIGGTNIIAGRCTSSAGQTGEFYGFPNISVNANNDVLIGFTRFSALTYPNSAYVLRRASDPPNTTRDTVVFRPGQSLYATGSGSSAATYPATPTRNHRWGDYSAAQTDPLNDIDFWTVQEYSGTYRNDFTNPPQAPWETYWALIKPSTPAASPSGSLIISEFRLRGPQGPRDEFIELYNPGATPLVITTTDNSDGWGVAFSSNGTTVTGVATIPNGTVIPAHGHLLLTDSPDNATQPTVVYSLNGAACTQVRGAENDIGWAFDLADNGGIAVFNTGTIANMNAGTRLDSVGFSTIAAGLFKEGNGIPAILATTPTGQYTFYRNLSTGVPADSGANENDFTFANAVVGETLGSTPKLGAPGPENLSSPISFNGAATLPATRVDTGISIANPPNRLRDNTVVTNGALGTLSFRRTFTNNTGAAMPRLRFRIVDMTTNPPAGGNADLRALSSGAVVVSLSGGGTANVDATTLETPPTQAAGGGLNGTLTVPGVTIATPLGAGATVNLNFTVGVQTAGNFNFCLEPEGDPATSLAPLCFAGFSENTLPSITGGSATRNQGDPGTTATIATVSDNQDAAGSLTVVTTSIPSGITVTGITNTAGTVTATVAADCTAAVGANNVALLVTDSEGATNTANFVVTVVATPAPTTPTITADTNGTGTQDQACPEVPLTLHANSTGATSYQWYKDIDLLSGETNSTYQATGAATYYVVAFNACGSSAQSAGYVVQNPTPHSPFVSFRGQDSSVTTLAICQGSSQIIDSDSATGIHWWKDGVDLGPGSQSLTVTTAGVYTAQLNALGCHSQFGRNVTVTVDAMPPTPTISGDTNGTGTQDQACPEQPLTLHANGATGATSYTWYSDNAVIPNENTSTLVMTGVGNISVTATNGTCTTAHSATYVVQNPTPHAPFITIRGQNSTVTSIAFCQGGSIILDSDSATGIRWWKDGVDLGPGAQSLTVTTSGVYTAQLNALGCHSQFGRNITVTVNPLPATPTITPGGPTTFCAGGSVTLTSSAASGNQWKLNGSPIGGATATTYNATASGSYTVTVTDGNGCSATSAPTSVTVNPLPATPTITPGGPTTFCQGGSVTLTSSAASGNQWNLNGVPIGGATATTFIASASGSYTVTVTDGNGCTATSAATVVTVNPIPAAPTITPGGPTTFCQGGSVTLNSSAASGNQWFLNGNPIGGATGASYVATASGNYTVTTTQSGCTSPASAATTVTVNPTPTTPVITYPTSLTFCQGGSVVLHSSSGSGNQWYLNGNPIGGATASTYTATASGNYTVVVTLSGCPSSPSAAATVTVNPNPNATITAPASVGTGSTGNIASVANAGAGATYNWGITNGTITAGTGTNSITFSAGASGSITLNVTVTTSAGCSDAKSASVTIDPPTITNVTPANGPFIGGQSVSINGTNFRTGATVTFGGTAATNVVVVNSTLITAKTPAHAPGQVNVVVTNTNGSTATLNNGYTYQPQHFDPNGDHTIDPSDIFYLINYLFLGGPAPQGPGGMISGDANGDGLVDPSDIFYAVAYLFAGGPAPASGGVVTKAAGEPVSGSLTLGEPFLRNGHTVVPVVLASGGATPQGVALRVRFSGNAGEMSIHRAGAAADLTPAFETSRQTGDALLWLVAFDGRTPLRADGSVVIAEVELADGAFGRLAFDPAVTMLSNAGGTRAATAANGHLQLRGVSLDGHPKNEGKGTNAE